MSYVLVWKDHDDEYKENFSDLEEVAAKLIKLCRLEHERMNGTEVKKLFQGSEVGYKYKRNDKDNTEEIFIEESLWIKQEIEKIKPNEVFCPICGNDGGLIENSVSIKTEDDNYGMDLYGCSECGREFCT